MQERLQKIIARAGIASRRKAEGLIRQGRVTVNGQVVREMGARADPERDHVKVNGKLLQPESKEYFVVYKPQGYLSAASDGAGRPVVTELVRSGSRLYPAGRLDFNSEGLILLTNDGELTRNLTKAGKVDKRYRVKVSGCPDEESLKRLRQGVQAGGSRFAPCRIFSLKRGSNCWFELVLREGKNRQIRRMFEAVGHPVMRLRRIAIGPIRLVGMKPGESRKLTAGEIERLKDSAGMKS